MAKIGSQLAVSRKSNDNVELPDLIYVECALKEGDGQPGGDHRDKSCS